MTKCCNQHDRCYDTCGREKHDCDDQFQDCLETICRNVQKTLGLAQSVQGKRPSQCVQTWCRLRLGMRISGDGADDLATNLRGSAQRVGKLIFYIYSLAFLGCLLFGRWRLKGIFSSYLKKLM